MTTSIAPGAAIGSGLPPGVRRGGLGRRFLAQLIDLVIPAILINVAVAAHLTIVTVVCGLGILVWEIVVWAMFATRAAGPGMRVVHLQLVRLRNGRAIGWGRYLVRALILLALTATGIGLLVLIFLLVSQRRHQGLHDLAVQSVVIVARPLAPPLVRPPAADAVADNKREAVVEEEREAVVDVEHEAAAADTHADEGAAGAVVAADEELADDDRVGARPEADVDEAEPTAEIESVDVDDIVVDDEPAEVEPEPPQSESPQSESDEPVSVDEPVTDEPVTDEPVTDEPVTDEPVTDEPVTDEPKIDEPGGAGAAKAEEPEPGPAEGEPDQAEAGVTDSGSGLPAEWTADPVAGRPVPRAEGWLAVLDDDQTLEITRLILVGRNPQSGPDEAPDGLSGEQEPLLIKVSDRARTVSKTHLALDVDEEGPFAIDRESTNGSAVTDIDGNYRLLGAGQQVRLTHGDVLAFGDHRIEIRHP